MMITLERIKEIMRGFNMVVGQPPILELAYQAGLAIAMEATNSEREEIERLKAELAKFYSEPVAWMYTYRGMTVGIGTVRRHDKPTEFEEVALYRRVTE